MYTSRRQFLRSSLASLTTLGIAGTGAVQACERPGDEARKARNASFETSMALDEQSRVLQDQLKSGVNVHALSVEEARVSLENATSAADIPFTEVFAVEDRVLPGPNGDIPVRVYQPGPPRDGNPYPLLLLFHGGGAVLGSIKTHDRLARYLCHHAGVGVMNVGYRLAPEHKFPAGVEDCYAALTWAGEHAGQIGADPLKLGVIGDSAGGNLSAVMCQLAKRRCGPRVTYQVLLYPSVTAMPYPEPDYPSRTLYGNGDYFLSLADKKLFQGYYFSQPDKERSDLRASPILAKDLSGLPQALIITAGFDMLRDEGRHYAGRLLEAGVDTEYKNYPTTIHGFISFAGALDAGMEALNYITARLRLVLS